MKEFCFRFDVKSKFAVILISLFVNYWILKRFKLILFIIKVSKTFVSNSKKIICNIAFLLKIEFLETIAKF